MKITCVHTIKGLIDVFEQLFMQYDVEVQHNYNGNIIGKIENANGFTSETLSELKDMLNLAEKSGTDAIFVTCSSLSRALDSVSQDIKVPIFTIDEPMLSEAVRME